MKKPSVYGYNGPMKHDDDNLIDWSAFDERSVRSTPVSGCGLLRVFSVLLFVLAAAGAVLGGMELKGALDAMSSGEPADIYTQADYAGRAVVFIMVSLATLLPGAFGLQMAANPKVSTAPIVIGVLGILVPGGLFALSLISAAANAGVEDFRLVVFVLLALLYTLLVILIRMNANMKGGGAHSGKHSKDALWDEKEIWK